MLHVEWLSLPRSCRPLRTTTCSTSSGSSAVSPYTILPLWSSTSPWRFTKSFWRGKQHWMTWKNSCLMWEGLKQSPVVSFQQILINELQPGVRSAGMFRFGKMLQQSVWPQHSGIIKNSLTSPCCLKKSYSYCLNAYTCFQPGCGQCTAKLSGQITSKSVTTAQWKRK